MPYTHIMPQLLVVLFILAALGLTFARPGMAVLIWLALLETAPDSWAASFWGREACLAFLKGFGVVAALALIWRNGPRWDKFNPAFGFLAVFIAGLAHGLYPGLTASDSLRSLIGSAAPFLFGFARLEAGFIRAARRVLYAGPLLNIALGAALTPLGLATFASMQNGLRLGGAGEPPFLAGFALTALYAALLDYIAAPRSRLLGLALLYLAIILLTGARAPLALGLAAFAALLVLRGNLAGFAWAGALCAIALLAENLLGFLRAVDLSRLGQMGNLSNRTLIWPFFENAFAQSPWLGWGLGAGKIIVPLNAPLSRIIGTNAAHNEYLRLGVEAGLLGGALLLVLFYLWAWHGTARLAFAQKIFMRLVFLLFAIHSATDNTLIATTSSALFLWVSCVFAEAELKKPAPLLEPVNSSRYQTQPGQSRIRPPTAPATAAMNAPTSAEKKV